jgi:hypothetical protein
MSIRTVIKEPGLRLAALLLAGGCCGHVQTPNNHHVQRWQGNPPRVPLTEAEIRQKIVGTWKAEDTPWGGAETISFGADGSFESMQPGRRPWCSTWQVQGGFVVIMQGKSLPSNGEAYWGIWHIDDQDLVFRPGFSTAGPPEWYRR